MEAQYPGTFSDMEQQLSYRDDLIIGKEYTVYGIEVRSNITYYFLYEENVDDISPYPYEADLFEISDSCPSSYWKFNIKIDESDPEINVQMVYPEWIEDPMHLENLIDGHPEDVLIFKKYSALMDEEFK